MNDYHPDQLKKISQYFTDLRDKNRSGKLVDSVYKLELEEMLVSLLEMAKNIAQPTVESNSRLKLEIEKLEKAVNERIDHFLSLELNAELCVLKNHLSRLMEFYQSQEIPEEEVIVALNRINMAAEVAGDDAGYTSPNWSKGTGFDDANTDELKCCLGNLKDRIELVAQKIERGELKEEVNLLKTQYDTFKKMKESGLTTIKNYLAHLNSIDAALIDLYRSL